MRGSTHLAAGLSVGVLAHPGAISTEMAIGIGVAGLAALAPDWIQINIPGASSIVHGVFGHRGISHSWFAAFAAGLVARFAAPSLAIFVLAGWSCHIWVDIFSGGAPALWPWPGRITLGRIKTGGALDTMVGAACLVMFVTILVWRML